MADAPSGAKARVCAGSKMYGLKPVPFHTNFQGSRTRNDVPPETMKMADAPSGAKARVCAGSKMYGLKPVPFIP